MNFLSIKLPILANPNIEYDPIANNKIVLKNAIKAHNPISSPLMQQWIVPKIPATTPKIAIIFLIENLLEK